jgi:hypothetical protein
MAMKITTNNTETSAYAQMGMAALLPGMVHMVEVMAAEVEKFRAQLAALQQGSAPARKNGARGGSYGWPADPEARKAEMQRRQTVAAQKKGNDGRKQSWAALSPARKKKRIAAMLAGRKKTQAQMLEKAA